MSGYDYYSQTFTQKRWSGPPMTEAVQEGERIRNAPNRWHLVANDNGLDPIETACGRRIEQNVARVIPRSYVEAEKETYRVRRCKRCWASVR